MAYLLPLLAVGQIVPQQPAQSVVVAPQPQQAAQPATSNVGVGAKDNIFESKTSENFADRLFDVKSDSIDLENGTLKWKGKTFSLGNSRMFKARFERYLAVDFSSQNLSDYKDIISEISATLSVKNSEITPASVVYAQKRLFDAAEYDYDGNASLAIANTVNTAWRTRDDRISKLITENELKKALKSEEAKQINFANYLEDRASHMAFKRNGKKGNTNASSTIALHGTADLQIATQKTAEALAKYTASQAETVAVGAKSVLQFQSTILHLLLSRRFSHTVIACDFYRNTYKGSFQNMEVGKAQMYEFFQISKFEPTSDTLQAIAQEACTDIKTGLKAVDTLFDAGEKYEALLRLMETFALGENEPELLNYPYEKKKVLHKIYKNMSTLKELADAHDFDAIENILTEMRKTVVDFPYAETLAKVKAAKRASNMSVMAAKQAAISGKLDDVEKNLTQAAKIWPLNPAIERLNEELVGLGDGISKYAPKFDELYSRGAYRDISAESLEYAMAFAKDPKRAQKLRQIVADTAKIDMIIAQSKEFEAQNNEYLAWELLENAKKIDANDPVLARRIAQLAPSVADFAKFVAAAEKAEKAREYPRALMNYLQARQISPSSQICRLAIQRLSAKYLEN